MAKKNLIYTSDMGVPPHQIGVHDDFLWYVTAHMWATTVSDTGTVAATDAANGVVLLTPSDGTVGDNDEAYLATANELFKVAAGRTIEGEALLKFTEANTDDANVAFMFQNAIAADSILDDGAGLKVSGDTFGIYKVDGGTVWKCVSCVNGTATVSTSGKTAGAAYQRLGIKIADVDGTNCEVTFFCDGVPLLDSTTKKAIKHTVAIASATEMDFGVGIKNGSANLETLYVDYIGAWQTR